MVAMNVFQYTPRCTTGTRSRNPQVYTLIALNPIFGIKRCLVYSHFAFILILHNEASHQEEMVYLSVALAFCSNE